MEETNQPASAPVSDFQADQSLIAQVEVEIAQRRAANGYDKPEVAKFHAAMSLPELSETDEARRRCATKEIEAKERERKRAVRMDSFLCSVGKSHARCRLSNFATQLPAQKRAFVAVDEYARSLADRIDARQGIIFFGPVGTGKDHLAVALGGIACEQHDCDVISLNVQNWFGEIRDAMDDDDPRPERSILNRYGWQDILILSDPLPPFGTLTQHQATMLYRLIDLRVRRGKLTWATVNVKDSAEADERMGAPTWDRLCDKAWLIQCRWETARKPAKIVNCE